MKTRLPAEELERRLHEASEARLSDREARRCPSRTLTAGSAGSRVRIRKG